MERDASVAASEWLAEFRATSRASSRATRLRRASSRVVGSGRRCAGVQYQAFVDPSGGRSDCMTLAIGHGEGRECCGARLRAGRCGRRSTRRVRWRTWCRRCWRTGSGRCCGDRFGGVVAAGGVPQARGVVSDGGAAEIGPVQGAVAGGEQPAVRAARSSPKLVTQLVGLERRVGRGGRDSIDHPPGDARRRGERGCGRVRGGARARCGGGRGFDRRDCTGCERWTIWSGCGRARGWTCRTRCGCWWGR